MKINKFSFGIGDRFGMQGENLLSAFFEARKSGLEITPVWNKSYREHKTVNTEPKSVRLEADAAVHAKSWAGPYLVDADHIKIETVDGFMEFSDFFTIDVADFIGVSIEIDYKKRFFDACKDLLGKISIPGIAAPYIITDEIMDSFADRYLLAIKESSGIYSHIKKFKSDQCIIEVSMDEVDLPQSPVDLLLILAGLAWEGVPVQTIAPKFSGRFNKGVDYAGDLTRFAEEFEEDIMVIRYAIQSFGLPETLKLSVHSGSDKFSIYPIIQHIINKNNTGLHVKTAGTTWLEELAGLAVSGNEGLEMVRHIYLTALDRYDELTSPYATVIDISPHKLPDLNLIKNWDGQQFYDAIAHNQTNPAYNPDLRQMMHVAYKIAAELGSEFKNAVRKNDPIIGPLVTRNIYTNHIEPIFLN
jgi:hypothetical protein